MLHGWVCISIISDEYDNHIATFVENGALGFLEKFMDEDFMNEFPNEDENDWWKKMIRRIGSRWFKGVVLKTIELLRVP